jgi:hypothetical protein
MVRATSVHPTETPAYTQPFGPKGAQIATEICRAFNDENT